MVEILKRRRFLVGTILLPLAPFLPMPPVSKWDARDELLRRFLVASLAHYESTGLVINAPMFKTYIDGGLRYTLVAKRRI